MSNKSRYHRTAEQRRSRGCRQTAVVGVATGAAMAAAFISMGTAHAGTGTDLDPFADIAPNNPGAASIDTLLNSFNPSSNLLAMGLDSAADNPSSIPAVYNAPLAAGVPTPFEDLVGTSSPNSTLALELDNYLIANTCLPGITPCTQAADLASAVQALPPVTTTPPADGDPFSDFVTATGNTNPSAATVAAQLDTTLHTQYPGTNIDAFVDNPSTIPSTLPTTDPASNDVFTDLLPANATSAQVTEAAQLDNYIVNPHDTALVATLNTEADTITPVTTTDADPFEDLLGSGATAAQIANAQAADQALVVSNPGLAAEFDKVIDATSTPVPSGTDADPFEDELGANASATQMAQALLADNALYAANPALAQSLDAQIDAGTTTTGTDADPFADLVGSDSNTLANSLDAQLNATDPNLAAQLDATADAGGTGNGADLDPLADVGFAANAPSNQSIDDEFLTPTQAAQLDVLIDQATANGGSLPAGSSSDADAFSDLGIFNGSTLDMVDSKLAQQLDPLVDQVLANTSSTSTTDLDPFEDVLPANATTAQISEAQVLDAQLAVLNPNLAAQLDATADAGTTGTGTGTDLDPFEDALPSTATSTQIADATAADQALAASNPTLAGQLDAAVDAGNLPAGTSGDADAFSDLGLSNGATLDAEFPALAQQLDPVVDQLTSTTTTTDADPFVDLLQAFDPSAFSSSGASGGFLVTIATDVDSALAPSGISAALDPIADNIIHVFDPTAAF
jgi:hypothetical protein